jgi:hypothetical protein
MTKSASLVLCMSVNVLMGCTTPNDKVAFFTKTSFGLDMESTPPGASIAYDRSEGYIGPRYDNGTVPPIAGSFSTDGGLVNRKIKQVYATGNAAKLVARISGAGGSVNEDFSGNTKVMVFGTGTVLGLKIGFGADGLLESFTLGYKRKEMSVIPVANGNFPSVLATFDTTAQAKDKSEAGLHIEQFFATGSAAIGLASQRTIQDMFTRQAQDALAEYRDNERYQRSLALDTLYCLSRVDDERLHKVWDNAETVGLFDDRSILVKLRGVSARQARSLYTSELGIIAPSSAEHTGIMRGHRAYVCSLAGG